MKNLSRNNDSIVFFEINSHYLFTTTCLSLSVIKIVEGSNETTWLKGDENMVKCLH